MAAILFSSLLCLEWPSISWDNLFPQLIFLKRNNTEAYSFIWLRCFRPEAIIRKYDYGTLLPPKNKTKLNKHPDCERVGNKITMLLVTHTLSAVRRWWLRVNCAEITTLETISLSANKWLILNRIISVWQKYLKPFKIISDSNTRNYLTLGKQMINIR